MSVPREPELPLRIAYLILAHNAPKHLQRLVSALKTPSSDVFIHVDAKSDIDQFGPVAAEGIHLLAERCAVYWGDFSQVQAILLLMRHALDTGAAYTRFVLLSGADYPIRSTEYIEDFFRQQPATEFINIVDMPNEKVGKPLSRVDKFWPDREHFFMSRVEAKLRRAAVRLGLLKVERDHRRYLGAAKPCGGSEWWALSRAACEYVLDYIDRHPDFVHFYVNTVYADELMIQTILGNSNFRPAVRHNLTYTDWRKGGSSPATMAEGHLEAFRSVEMTIADDAYGTGELLFARKFREDSAALADGVDVMRQTKSGRFQA